MNHEAEYKFLDDSIAKLRSNYENTGRKASGNWSKSLEPKVIKTNNGVKMQIWGERYTGALIPQGRSANKTKSVDEAKKLYPIALQWIKDKGLNFDNSRAFAIALKWVYKGIKVPNTHNKGDILDNVINDQWMKDGIKAVGGALLSDFQSEFIENLKKV